MDKKDFFKKYNLEEEWLFETAFDGKTEEESYLNLRVFLIKNGYGDIPLPVSARRLWWDYIKPDENGNFGSFVWHPIKITQHVYHLNGLHLMIFNEEYPDHMALWEGTYGDD
ncbi:MAG: hypothetical protein H6600_03665 [Flavobacteriales bacterium]|nr:hypothetical protein [Flavobacteriales bacterium]